MGGAIPETLPDSPPRGRGSLTSRLVLRTVALVAVVALVLSLFSTLAVQQLLVGQLDAQLDATVTRQQKGGKGDGGPSRPPGIDVGGQRVGTLVVIYLPNGTAQAGVLDDDGRPQPVDADVVTAVAQMGVSDKITVDLSDLGRYRLISQSRGTAVVVIGLPMHEVDGLLASLIGLEALLTLLAMVASGLVAREVVVRSLRPLTRLAEAAREVSTMRLDRGDIDLGVRIAAEDANPAHEVGQVGYAFNHMLNNVETALAARQASETKVRQFVADASHELRNPLASIRGYAELTRRDRPRLPEGTSFALSRIESESVRMTSLVEDLLLLARLDSGPDLVLGPVDLSEVILNAVSDSRAAGPDHRWQLDLPDEPVVVDGDQHRLHQVVVNLLANARTHTPAGTTVSTSVRVEPVGPTGPTAALTVADDGPGVPPEIADHVFERFTRADSARARSDRGGPSTGLGLAIVAAVVDGHHGVVRATSRPGDTRFEIRLPVSANRS